MIFLTFAPICSLLSVLNGRVSRWELKGAKGVLAALTRRGRRAAGLASAEAASAARFSAVALPVALGPHCSSRLRESPAGCESRLPPPPLPPPRLATRLDSCSPRLMHGLIEILGTETERRGGGNASPLRGDVECLRGASDALRPRAASSAAARSGERGGLLLVEPAGGAAEGCAAE